MSPASDFDAQVRAADLDRWLSSRLVSDAHARADLIVLYAFEAELASIPAKVSQPLLAEMRLTWWTEQLDGVFAGAPRKGHPLLEALSDVVVRRGLERAPLEALIEAQVQRAHRQSHDLDALFVGPMQAAARVLAGPGHEDAVADAARVRGLILTGRAEEARSLRAPANRALRSLPPEAFPAVAAAALSNPDAPEPIKRLRLIWASLTGRI